MLNDETILLDLGNGHKLSLKDFYEGTAIFGATGSGKSSGSCQAIAKSFLREGLGGLVLTAKVDEYRQWQRWAEEVRDEKNGVDRTGDLVRFSPEGPYLFNSSV